MRSDEPAASMRTTLGCSLHSDGDPTQPLSTARLRTPVGLALQGGGSWGAYTWGVLDALLASRGVDVAQLFVTVTNVKTGLPRVMSNDALSIDVLLGVRQGKRRRHH